LGEAERQLWKEHTVEFRIHWWPGYPLGGASLRKQAMQQLAHLPGIGGCGRTARKLRLAAPGGLRRVGFCHGVTMQRSRTGHASSIRAAGASAATALPRKIAGGRGVGQMLRAKPLF